MSENKFAEGIIYKTKQMNDTWTKRTLSIKTEDFMNFLDSNDNNGRVNLILGTSKNWKNYVALDTWVPDSSKKQSTEQNNKPIDNNKDIQIEDIPF